MSYVYIQKFEHLITISLVLSFLLHILVVILLDYNNLFLFSDSVYHFQIVNKIKNVSNISFSTFLNINQSLHIGYSIFNFIIFSVFNNKLSLYLANVLLFHLSLIYFYKYINENFNRYIAKTTVILMIFNMHFWVFTSTLLKDGLVMFLSVFIIYIYIIV